MDERLDQLIALVQQVLDEIESLDSKLDLLETRIDELNEGQTDAESTRS
jgi:prefoldin subunit 5